MNLPAATAYLEERLIKRHKFSPERARERARNFEVDHTNGNQDVTYNRDWIRWLAGEIAKFPR